MAVKETPRQFSARHLRLAIERAKVSVIEAQEELIYYRGNPSAFNDMLRAAFSRLDKAWVAAYAVERPENRRLTPERE